jgi:uncharacterized protein
MGKFEDLKKAIINNYDRLGLDDTFKFKCSKGLACFTHCCGDVSIVLTPYDIIRMKKRVGLDSDEFLKQYTISPFTTEQPIPIVLLKMRDDEYRRCQFVEEDGCTIYEDRPWPCRMYPVGLASHASDDKSGEQDFHFILKEMPCEGFDDGDDMTIREWLADQGMDEYNEQGELFKEISLHKYLRRGGQLSPQQMEMFHMVCYDIDKFRAFLFNTSFFDRFIVDPETVEKIKSDDLELLKFGYKWLKFSIFGEKIIDVRDEAVEKVKQKNESTED